MNYDFNWNIVVHQTSVTLLWTLYELARHPDLQEEIRAEISAARIASKGDVVQMLKMVPLIKGALKETLRYTNTFCSIMGTEFFQKHILTFVIFLLVMHYPQHWAYYFDFRRIMWHWDWSNDAEYSAK